MYPRLSAANKTGYGVSIHDSRLTIHDRLTNRRSVANQQTAFAQEINRLAFACPYVLLAGDSIGAGGTSDVWRNKLILCGLAHLVRRLREIRGTSGDVIVSIPKNTRFDSFLPGMPVMRCLFTHKWAIGTEINDGSHGPAVRSVLPYRTCERCGTMQRGIFTSLWKDLSWETMRERTYNKLQQRRIVRQPSSRFNRLAHSLGLRRSRMGDRTAPRERSELIPS